MKKETTAKKRVKQPAKKLLADVLPFLSMAGIVPQTNQRKALKKITITLGHQTVLLPIRTIKRPTAFKRGLRYVIMKDGQPVATINLSPVAKGRKPRYHVTYGRTIKPLYEALHWMTHEYGIESMEITAIKAPFLGKNYLHSRGITPQQLFEVGDNIPPAGLSLHGFLKHYNKTIGFLLKGHTKFKREQKKKIARAQKIGD